MRRTAVRLYGANKTVSTKIINNTMTEKFQNKYRVPSARWQSWDYSADGLYFITICTANREYLFGEIRDGEMYLSEIGMIVNEEWEKSFEIRKELFCDIFQIMPNHIHAILRIENHRPVETHGRASQNAISPQNFPISNNGISQNHNNTDRPDFPTFDDETHGRASLPKTGVAYRTPHSISSFMGGFKSAATVRINELRHTPHLPVWQTRFHDHVIRDQDEYRRIYLYIKTNVENWEKDTFFTP